MVLRTPLLLLLATLLLGCDAYRASFPLSGTRITLASAGPEGG